MSILEVEIKPGREPCSISGFGFIHSIGGAESAEWLWERRDGAMDLEWQPESPVYTVNCSDTSLTLKENTSYGFDNGITPSCL